jgi:putative glutamine amidotransferase
MGKAVIGLTPRKEGEGSGLPIIGSPRVYIKALTLGGAVPIIIPLGLGKDELARLVSRLDGVLFTGGGDIDVNHFQGSAHPHVYGVDKERDQLELILLDLVMESRLPFLGICRGLQLINVGFGGTLYTHIMDQMPGALDHSYREGDSYSRIAHSVKLEAKSHLATIFDNEQVEVNSLHHQGIERLGAGLVSCGLAPDGLVEAVEVKDYPFGVGVQWHPELLSQEGHAGKLFSAFIAEMSRGGK